MNSGCDLLWSIHSYVVDIVVHRECIVDGFASVIATDGEVEQYVLRCVEWVLIAASTSVDGFREVNVVEEFVVEIDAYVVFGPIHAPRVEAFVPIGVALKEMLVGYAF